EDGVVPEPATQPAEQPADSEQTAEGTPVAPADDEADGDILGASPSREDLPESERSGPHDDYDLAGGPQAVTGGEAHPAPSAAEAMSEDSDEPAAGSDSDEPVAGE
ncbi:MAG: hypothetical protein ACO2ZJ_10755, partial [Pseudohongiellaceae bacterium]